MHLPSHTLSSQLDQPVFTHASFAQSTVSPDVQAGSLDGHPNESTSVRSSHKVARIFACPTPSGFLVAQTNPLKIVARRVYPPQHSTLSICAPISSSSLLVLVGGGVSPRFAPNKVILWDEAATGSPQARKSRAARSYTTSNEILFDAGSRLTASRHSMARPSSATCDEKPAESAMNPEANIDPFEHIGDADVRRRIDAWRQDTVPVVPSDFSTQASTLGVGKPERKGLDSPEDASDDGSDAASTASEVSLPSSEVSQEAMLQRSADLSPSQLFQSLVEPLSDHPEGTDSQSTASVRPENVALPDDSTLLSRSMSISASSADLADPFVSEDSGNEGDSREPILPSASMLSRVTEAPQVSAHASRQGVQGSSVLVSGEAPLRSLSERPQHDIKDRSQPPHSFDQSTRSPQLLATDAHTPRAAAKARKRRRGQAISSLEFAEAVLGVCVQEFDLPAPATPRKGKEKAVTPEKSLAKISSSRKATILIVILRSKAVVFELGLGLAPVGKVQRDTTAAGASQAVAPRNAWGIAQRAVLDIVKGRSGARAEASGLAALAPVRLPGGTSAHKYQVPGCIIALPGRQPGHIQLVELPFLSYTGTTASTTNRGAATIIAAHTSALATLTLSADGTLLSTSSQRGTLLRIWSTGFQKRVPSYNSPGYSTTFESLARKVGSVASFGTAAGSAVLLRELRRGTDPARVLSVAFEPRNRAIACASDKGTIHIFRLPLLGGPSGSAAVKGGGGGDVRSASFPSSEHVKGAPAAFTAAANKYLPTKLSRLASQIPATLLPPYLTSAWSDAKFRIPLRSFSAAGARGGRASPGGVWDRDGSGEGGDAEYAAGGASETARTTEGAWASMRNRLDDVRKGEAGTDEKIFLTWVPSKEEEDGDETYDLIALTTSGGWHRIGLDDTKGGQEEQQEHPSDAKRPHHKRSTSSSSSLHGDDGEASVVLDMYRSSAKRSSISSTSDRIAGSNSNDSTRPASRESAHFSTAASSNPSTSAFSHDADRGSPSSGRPSRRRRPDTNAEGCQLKEFKRFTSTPDAWDD